MNHRIKVFNDVRQWLLDNPQDWIKGDFIAIKDNGGHKHCLMGAIQHRLGECQLSMVGYQTMWGYRAAQLYRDELVETIRMNQTRYRNDWPEKVNDREGYDTVIELLDATIARLEAVDEAEQVLAQKFLAAV